jgi:hypothetical protein
MWPYRLKTVTEPAQEAVRMAEKKDIFRVMDAAACRRGLAGTSDIEEA